MNGGANDPHRQVGKRSVSVAMATFNGERFISEQLDSILSQTLIPDELVIVDDASADETVRICREFAASAPFRVRIIPLRENVGYIRSFERALLGCECEYIFLCDQDDVWSGQKVETMVQMLEAAPGKYLAIHDLSYCDAQMVMVGETKLGRFRDLGGADRNFVTGMATVVRRKLLETALPFPNEELVTHDAWLHECALALDVKIIVKEVLAGYRRHGTNATNEKYINAGAKQSATQLVRSALRASSRRQVAARLKMFECVADWLVLQREKLINSNLITSGRHAKKTAEYRSAAEWARRRLALLKYPRSRRVIRVVANYLQGGYRPFSGVKSALKDLTTR
jgi:glycosyltransferase involved in cell wall biosynthesis